LALVLAGLIVFGASTVMSIAGLGATGFYVPLFFWLGVPLREALPTALFLNVVALSLATFNYIRYGLVDFRIGLPLVSTALLFAPLGVLTSQLISRDLLLFLFAGFLVLAALFMLFYRPRMTGTHVTAAEAGGDPETANVAGSRPIGPNRPSLVVSWLRDTKKLTIGSGVGALAGYVAGLLAIGGGIVVIPALVFLRYPPKVVVATTGLVAFSASLSGFVSHIFFGQLNHSLLLGAGVAAAGGALAGSWLVCRCRLSSTRFKTFIGVLMLFIALKLVADLVF